MLDTGCVEQVWTRPSSFGTSDLGCIICFIRSVLSIRVNGGAGAGFSSKSKCSWNHLAVGDQDIYKERKAYYDKGRGSELPAEERVPTPAEARCRQYREESRWTEAKHQVFNRHGQYAAAVGNPWCLKVCLYPRFFPDTHCWSLRSGALSNTMHKYDEMHDCGSMDCSTFS